MEKNTCAKTINMTDKQIIIALRELCISRDDAVSGYELNLYLENRYGREIRAHKDALVNRLYDLSKYLEIYESSGCVHNSLTQFYVDEDNYNAFFSDCYMFSKESNS